ncbi:hypothetical protein [Sphingobacterium paucimobilis]|uniref:Uncharacterized protein n=1 Tax=Sphingobacterium paucimobilis HER1398 TaxID=1346330 RepID=U2J1F7_9SPHI|nr:hypothetical protein [Sphingobacterium paucimobilis]ERJ58809.1 hypothetical protein M472_08510 [Sphingobacterium paucimobilis HER1398]
MKAIAFIKKYATAGIALAAIIGFSAFKMSDDPIQSTRVLAYNNATEQYEEVTDYNTNKCIPGTEICSFTTEAEIGSAPGQVPSEIPLDQLNDYLPLMTQLGDNHKQYDFSK